MLKRIIVLMMVLLLAANVFASGRAEQAEAESLADITEFDWRRYEGTSIDVLMISSTHTNYIEPLVPEFEELTGINVNLQNVAEQIGRQRLAIEFAAGGRTVDAFDTSLHVEKSRFADAGWYEPLNDYLDSNLTMPGFDFDDFFEGTRRAVTTEDGEIIAIPTKPSAQFLMYRKDLLEEAGLSVPTNIEEFEAAVRELHDPPNVYGYGARGVTNANVYTFAFPFQYFGGEYLDADGNINFASEAGVQAAEWYAHMLNEYGPPGSVNFNWNEPLGMFQQGRLAFWNDSSSFGAQLEDTERSTVAGRVGYSVLPGSIAPTTHGALAVSSRSANKGAAYYFVQWVTSKEINDRLIEDGLIAARQSSWNEAPSNPLETITWAGGLFDGLNAGDQAFPSLTTVSELRDILGNAIVEVIQGGDAQRELQEAQREFQQLMDRERR